MAMGETFDMCFETSRVGGAAVGQQDDGSQSHDSSLMAASHMGGSSVGTDAVSVSRNFKVFFFAIERAMAWLARCR
eukprot:4450141-Prymnesium_polylepis.1